LSLAGGCLLDGEQWLVEFNGFTGFNQYGPDRTVFIRFNLVHHLHRLDDTDDVPGLDALADFDKGCGGR
jgi:hypothetical protein